MSAQLQRRLFTVKEYHQMLEIGILSKDYRVELIEGEIIQIPATGISDEICLKQLIKKFQQLPENTAILDFKNQVQLSKQTKLKPDLVLLHFRHDRRQIAAPEAAEVLLLIEITDSMVGNDRDIKIPIYARSMIREVWLVDLAENCLEVYREPTPDGYSLILKLRQCQEIAPIAFPDFAVSVSAVLPAVNK
jgi:Uma2 family endonuclease